MNGPAAIRETFVRFVSQLKPVAAPSILIIISLASLLIIRHWSSLPKATDSMQAEMNEQYDRFQAGLVKTTDAMVQMQRRLALAETSREQLNEAYEKTALELAKTQKALIAAEKALDRTQNSLAAMQHDYAALQKQKNTSSGESREGQDPAQIARIGTLEKQRRDILNESKQVARAVENNREQYKQTWDAYVELVDAIAKAKNSKARSEHRPEAELKTRLQAPEIPHMSLPSSATLPGNLTLDQRVGWLEQMIQGDSDRLLSLQQELQQLINAINETNAKILEGRAELETLGR